MCVYQYLCEGGDNIHILYVCIYTKKLEGYTHTNEESGYLFGKTDRWGTGRVARLLSMRFGEH